MTITAAVNIKGYIQALGAGRVEIDSIVFDEATAIPTKVVLELASGANTISCSSSCRGVIITNNPASTRTKTLKGVAGDTGIVIASSGFGGTFVLLLDAVSSFVINSSGADTGILTEFQFF